jgi:hypothetical protein
MLIPNIPNIPRIPPRGSYPQQPGGGLDRLPGVSPMLQNGEQGKGIMGRPAQGITAMVAIDAARVG